MSHTLIPENFLNSGKKIFKKSSYTPPDLHMQNIKKSKNSKRTYKLSETFEKLMKRVSSITDLYEKEEKFYWVVCQDMKILKTGKNMRKYFQGRHF